MSFLAGRMAADRQTYRLTFICRQQFHGDLDSGNGAGLCYLKAFLQEFTSTNKATPPWVILGPLMFKPPQCRMVLHEKQPASGFQINLRYNHVCNFSIYISVILYTYVNAYIHHPDLSVLDNLYWILIKKDEFISPILPSILQTLYRLLFLDLQLRFLSLLEIDFFFSHF